VTGEWGNWFESHLPGHHHTSAAQPAATATIGTATPGGPVSQLSDTLHNLAAKVEHFDDEALNGLVAVKANPKTAEAFALIRAVSHVDPGPYFDSAVDILRLLDGQINAVPADPGVPQFTPAGPQVAGQAQG